MGEHVDRNVPPTTTTRRMRMVDTILAGGGSVDRNDLLELFSDIEGSVPLNLGGRQRDRFRGRRDRRSRGSRANVTMKSQLGLLRKHGVITLDGDMVLAVDMEKLRRYRRWLDLDNARRSDG
jgi:hypothetical protein